jgi:hypothetical protein
MRLIVICTESLMIWFLPGPPGDFAVRGREEALLLSSRPHAEGSMTGSSVPVSAQDSSRVCLRHRTGVSGFL